MSADIDKERADFEAHIRSECDTPEYAILVLQKTACGTYTTTRIQGAWEGWQARGRLVALSGKGDAGAWQPIETAPRDGRTILLGRAANEEKDQDPISTAGRWQKGWEDSVDDMGCDDGFVDLDYQVFSPSRSFGAEAHRHDGYQPTHWKHFPATPQTAPSQGKSAAGKEES